jgi:hypothetical protein
MFKVLIDKLALNHVVGGADVNGELPRTTHAPKQSGLAQPPRFPSFGQPPEFRFWTARFNAIVLTLFYLLVEYPSLLVFHRILLKSFFHSYLIVYRISAAATFLDDDIGLARIPEI